MPKANSYIYPGTIALMPPAQVISAVTEVYKTSYSNLLINTRKREIVEPRQVLMTLLLILAREKCQYIGLRFGRDHATVLHARKTIAQLYQTNKGIREKVEGILLRLRLDQNDRHAFYCSLFIKKIPVS